MPVISDTAAMTLHFSQYELKEGMAMAEIMPITAVTVRSSTRVKPFAACGARADSKKPQPFLSLSTSGELTPKSHLS